MRSDGRLSRARDGGWKTLKSEGNYQDSQRAMH